MATPSLAMIPSAYADSKVYSVLPNNGDGDFTFNRDSSATRVGQNGLIQTVGYYSNNLVTNGDFATDIDWTKETGWTISGGTANFSGGTGNKAMYQAVGITNGKTYKIQYTVSSISAGQVAVRFGGMSGVDEITATIIGTYTGYITATGSANGNIHIEDNDNNFVGSIDNVSVVEVTGDQPRLNYDISNGVVQSCPSLLLEPASTNLINFSEDFSDSSWIKIGSTEIISNNSTSPNGSLNSDKVNASTTYNGILGFQDGFSVLSSSDYSVSFFAKKGNLRYLQLFNGGGQVVGNARTNFDLENGIITVSDSGHDASIENYGNGWFRCIVSLEALSTTLQLYFNAVKDANATRSAASDFNENDNLFIWGIQLEQSNYPTSYIPTNGSSQTRAAETCNDAGNAATFNSTEGVLYAEISALANDLTNRRITISDGTNTNRVVTGYNTTSNQIFYFVVVGGSTVASGNYTSSDITELSKIAIKFKANDFALWVDGVERHTDTSGAIFSANTLSSLQFEQGSGGALFFYGNTKDIRVYNEALTDAQLQTLTTL